MSNATLYVLMATALLAGGGVAHSADFAVKIAGRSPAEVRQDIMVAADKVCARAVAMNEVEATAEDQCVSDTVDEAMKKVTSQTGDFNIAASGTSSK